jgi:3-oxoacyl-[acyl-carrier protein] reductase
MAKRRSGKVLFVLSSVTEGRPPAALSHYVTAKYAVLGLMRSLSQEYAAKNIQINGVSPSMVETKFLSDLDEKFLQLAAEAHPLKRNARVDDIVSAMSLLLTEGSDYMSGVNLPITGGA